MRMNVRMLTPFSLSLALAAPVLFGCTVPNPPPPPATGKFQTEQIDLSHQVRFHATDAELAPTSGRAIELFLVRADPDQKAEVYLDAAGPLAEARLEVVEDVLGDIGRSIAGTGAATPLDNVVTVTVRRQVALPVACLHPVDEWPDPLLLPAGCSNALNLARMVEDEDDLLVGRELAPAPAWPAVSAMDRHYGRRDPVLIGNTDNEPEP